MKILFIYTDKFGYKVGKDQSENPPQHAEYSNCQTAFIQVEEEDEQSENTGKLITKLVKQVKWISRKNQTNVVVLHSFAHLSKSKATSEFSKSVFDQAQEKLESTGFNVYQTPFGYFLDLELNAPGKSLARVFIEL